MANGNSRKEGPGGNAARFFGVGFTFVFTICVFAAGGFFLDRLLGTVPLFIMVGLVVGMASGLYYIYLVMKKIGES